MCNGRKSWWHTGQSEGLADEESDADTIKGDTYISLKVERSKEPNLETPVKPIIIKNLRDRNAINLEVGNTRAVAAALCA